MQIEYKKPSELVPYENNPRKNDDAVDKVAASITEFGFNVPIVVDKNNVIIAGHTRLKAAEKLGMKEVPTICAEDLTEEQVKAYRLADNKTGELAGWDFNLLADEMQSIESINMEAFGFPTWFDAHHSGKTTDEDTEEYKEFLEKFADKHTTDDCYTPPLVYDAVAEWVVKEYKVKRENFVRPFYPGGDYQKETYKATDIVVDNPPFSIMSEIIHYYTDKGVKFFLFAPSLALMNYVDYATGIALQAVVEYENGAKVPTSFITNLEDKDVAIRTAPELYKAVVEASKESARANKRELPKYAYPDHVVTAAMMGKWSKYGIEQSFGRKDGVVISELDAQKEKGKAIYGRGLLLSERAAAERAAAERAAAERAAAERWELSVREWDIVRSLG